MKSKLPTWMYLSAAIVTGAGSMTKVVLAKEVESKLKPSIAKGQGRAPASVTEMSKLILGSWNLEHITERCDDLIGEHRGEVWHFENHGKFVRTTSDGRPAQTGRWNLREGAVVITIPRANTGEEHEEHFIRALDGKQLEMLAPTQIRNGTVVTSERYTAFFHS